jgi:anti-sigma factor (TIGR02949 family)
MAEEVNVSDCREVRAKLGRFADCELPPDDQASVRNHIQECSGCRNELNAIQGLSTTLNRLVVPPVPDGLSTAVMSRVCEQPAATRWAWGAFEFWAGWSAGMRAAACATVTIACLIGLVLGSSASAASSRTRSDMAWVGLSSGAPITSAYLETAR